MPVVVMYGLKMTAPIVISAVCFVFQGLLFHIPYSAIRQSYFIAVLVYSFQRLHSFHDFGRSFTFKRIKILKSETFCLV